MITERGETAHLRYDANDNILYFTFPGVTLETPIQIVEHFDRCIAFWKRHCAGRRVYCVVDYDGIHVNVKCTDTYAAQLQRMSEMAITIIRYGGSSLQRTAVRLASMKLHTPSKLYASQEEALAVVKKLKSGEMSIAPPSS